MQAVGWVALHDLWGQCMSSHGCTWNLGVFPWAGVDSKPSLSLQATLQLFHQPVPSSGCDECSYGAAHPNQVKHHLCTHTDHQIPWFMICMWTMKSIPRCPSTDLQHFTCQSVGRAYKLNQEFCSLLSQDPHWFLWMFYASEKELLSCSWAVKLIFLSC